MRKVLTCIAGLVLLSVVLSSCDVQVTPDAAKVDSASISKSELNSMLTVIAQSSGYRCIIESDSSGLVIEGSGQDTYAMSFGAAVLSLLVNRQIVDDEVARLHLATDAYVQTVGLDALAQDLTIGSSSTCKVQGAALVATLPPELKSLLLNYWTNAYLLASYLVHIAPTAAGIASYVAQHPNTTDVACIGEIVLSSQAEAESIAAAARKGTNFADLARAHSLDTSSSSNGGLIGCDVPTDFAAPYAAAIPTLRIGEISSPIAISGYYSVLKVESRRPAPAADGPLSLIRLEGDPLSSFIQSLSKSANVQVDPNFGSWKDLNATWQVDPPSGPAQALVSNSAAVVPSLTSTSG